MHELAQQSLETLMQAAILDGFRNGKGRGKKNAQASIIETGERLRASTRDRAAVNPHYVPFPEMVDSMLVLAAVDEDACKRFFDGIGGVDPRTFTGFLRFCSVISALGDDHDYLIDARDPTAPRLLLEIGPRPEGVSGATPLGVHAALEPLVAELGMASAPVP